MSTALAFVNEYSQWFAIAGAYIAAFAAFKVRGPRSGGNHVHYPGE